MQLKLPIRYLSFKFSAINYLLKPVVKEELINSVNKAASNIAWQETAMKFETLLHNLRPDNEASKKICHPTTNGLDFVLIQDITRCQSSGNYTIFFLKNGQKMTVSHTLKKYETLLDAYNFFRVHHSHLVNIAYIKLYNKGKGGICDADRQYGD